MLLNSVGGDVGLRRDVGWSLRCWPGDNLVRSVASGSVRTRFGDVGGFLLRGRLRYITVIVQLDVSTIFTDFWVVPAGACGLVAPRWCEPILESQCCMGYARPTPPTTIWTTNVIIPCYHSPAAWAKGNGPLAKVNVNIAADTDQKTFKPNETPPEDFWELGTAKRLNV